MPRSGRVINAGEPASAADPERRIQEVCTLLEAYLGPQQVEQVYAAYQFSAAAHEGQRRRSGEAYIVHPIAVARILAEMRLDAEAITAALLHDVIEDTPTAKESLVERFGEQVAELVDGVSKLDAIDAKTKTKAEAQAESFRKMILAMAQDIRVILIKLADRLHNMRTIWIMPPEKRRQIARETLDIYAPIAQRLGINSVRTELEDHSFAAHYPLRYRALKEKLARQRGRRGVILDTVCEQVRSRLQEAGIEAEVAGREKHLWSIYCKMAQKQLHFRDIFDVYGFRVVVDSIDDCYRVLGILHRLYKPRPGRIKDYIAIPKANGYQSLHTTLVGPHRIRLEAQVRTREMHAVAESGIAAHWLYKEEGTNTAQVRAREWVKDLLEMQRSVGTSQEFIESVKIDLVPDEVYVFTPKGDILELPSNATPVDLAYAIHSDIGDACVAAKVDHRLTPLRTPLQTGQMVEIITAPTARPNPVWLDFVVTAKARTAIRHALKRLKDEEAVEIGRRMVERALSALSLDLDGLEQARIDETLAGIGVHSLAELFREVGLGNRVPWLVAQQLSGLEQADVALEGYDDEHEPHGHLTIRGNEGAVITFGRCCRPIPGDPIVGFASTGRGVVIHHRDCKNVAASQRKRSESWVDVDWEASVDAEFPTQIALDVVNERGALAQLAHGISERGASIENVHIEERDGMVAVVHFLILVRDRRHLATVMRHLRAMSPVQRIVRKKDG